MSTVLRVEQLTVAFARGQVPVVRDLSLAIDAGEIVALVGESGSGKSTAALALMGLLDEAAQATGAIRLACKSGQECDVLALPERQIRRIRGEDMAMIFQEPMASLDPIWAIGAQIGEAIATHRRMSSAARDAEALRLLRSVAIADPENCLTSYPHQLSGGMRQRVMIAIALSCQPRLLIADEPTTALDATIQAQIIDQLREAAARTGMAMLFITHDLGLVAEIADRVLVMYAGRIVEAGPVTEVFANPRMPYTRGLMRSRPRIGSRRSREERIEPIPGNVPNPASLPGGCAFHPRCAHAEAGRCDRALPMLEDCGRAHAVRCLRWQELAG